MNIQSQFKSFFYLIKFNFNTSIIGLNIWNFLISKSKKIIVSNQTDLVIEGFPRSGNTFIYAVFKLLSNNKISIARHKHEIGQLKKAIKLKKLNLVIIRNPTDSILSLIVRENVTFSFAIYYYREYYKFLIANKNKLTFVSFDQFTSNTKALCSQLISNSLGSISHQINLDLYDFNKIKEIIIELDVDDNKGMKNNFLKIGFPNDNRNKVKLALHPQLKKYKKDMLFCEKYYEQLVNNSNE